MRPRVVLVCGNFNIVHPGHIRLLRFAKNQGGELWIGVASDRIGGKAVYIPESLRLEGVASNVLVDKAFIFDDDVTSLIGRLKPDIVVKGKEFEFQNNPEQEALDAYGGQLMFSSGEVLLTSSDLLRRELLDLGDSKLELDQSYLDRHSINIDGLINIIDRFRQVRACVVGDLIVDEYITCDSLGMSQEDPSIVVTPIESEQFVGGAGIVAGHGVGLGSSVDFISVVGSDEISEFAKRSLDKYAVRYTVVTDASRPTTLKQRYRSAGKTLLRVSHMSQAPISRQVQDEVLSRVTESLKDAQLLVFSDFNHGCLPQRLVDEVIRFAKAREVIMVADSQSSSQIGDIGRFTQMDLLTPTEREARIAMRNNQDGLVVLAELLRERSQSKSILLKMGSEGLLVHNHAEQDNQMVTDKFPALNQNPKDVAGAGDSLLMTSALSIAAGSTIWEAALLGSVAASIQVSRVGNTPLQSDGLKTVLRG